MYICVANSVVVGATYKRPPLVRRAVTNFINPAPARKIGIAPLQDDILPPLPPASHKSDWPEVSDR